MGILGNLFGMQEDTGNDLGARIALASQVLMAMDRGQVANIAPAVADLNAQRRKYMDQAKSQKWLQSQAASMADKNPRLAAMLQDAPPGVGESLISKYLETQFQPPDWKTFESQGDVYRVDMRDPNAKPSLLFDGPEDPFKALLKSIDPTAGQPPASAPIPGAPAEIGAPPTSSSATPDMPPTGGTLTPPMKVLAQSFGLPETATADDVMAVANAGAIGGKEAAQHTADQISKRYADAKSQGFELTQKQNENAFKLQDDYWRVGSKYQEIMNAADSMSSVPDDPNGFERVMTMYKYMRALDPLGAVRESDAALAQSASGPYARLEQLFSQYSGMSGSEIPKPAALEMKRLILEMGETASKADYKARKKTISRAKAMGIPEDKAEGAIFGGLQDNVDMSGYTPRFNPAPRAGNPPPSGSSGPTMNWDPISGVQQ